MNRLSRSGVAHIIYLVEGQLEKVRSLDCAAVQTALASTQLEERYIVMHTLSLATTIERIASITKMIEAEHAQTNWDEEERGGRLTVEQFLSNASKSKNLSVCCVWRRSLLPFFPHRSLGTRPVCDAVAQHCGRFAA